MPPSIKKEIRILNKKINIICSILLKIKEDEDIIKLSCYNKFSELVKGIKNKYVKEENEKKKEIRDRNRLTGDYGGETYCDGNLIDKRLIVKILIIFFIDFKINFFFPIFISDWRRWSTIKYIINVNN